MTDKAKVVLGGRQKRGRPKTPEDVKLFRKVRDLFAQIVFALAKPETVSERKRLDLENTAERMARRLVYDSLSYPDPASLELETYEIPDAQVCVLVEGPIPFSSTCAHHGTMFHGEIYLGILPGECFLPRADYARIVDCLSRRFQLQEKLGGDILDVLVETLNPIAVVVRVVSREACLSCKAGRSRSIVGTSHVWPIDAAADSVLREINAMMEAIRT